MNTTALPITIPAAPPAWRHRLLEAVRELAEIENRPTTSATMQIVSMVARTVLNRCPDEFADWAHDRVGFPESAAVPMAAHTLMLWHVGLQGTGSVCNPGMSLFRGPDERKRIAERYRGVPVGYDSAGPGNDHEIDDVRVAG